MSTKIYTGIRFSTDNLNDVVNILQQFRSSLEYLIHDKTLTYLIKSAILKMDKDALSEQQTNKNNYFSDSFIELMDKQHNISINKKRHPDVDFKTSVTIFPHNGTFYGMVFTEQNEFYNLLLQYPIVEEYSYWNNTDKPNNITEDEWLMREDIWNDIFKDVSIPEQAGFTQVCHSGNCTPTMNDVISNWEQHLPSIEERSQYWTNELFLTEELKEYPPDAITTINVVKIVREITSNNSPETQLKKEIMRLKILTTINNNPLPEHVGLADPTSTNKPQPYKG